MYRDPRDQAVSRMFHIRRDKGHAWYQRFNHMSNDQALMACIAPRHLMIHTAYNDGSDPTFGVERSYLNAKKAWVFLGKEEKWGQSPFPVLKGFISNSQMKRALTPFLQWR